MFFGYFGFSEVKLYTICFDVWCALSSKGDMVV